MVISSKIYEVLLKVIEMSLFLPLKVDNICAESNIYPMPLK